MRDQVEGNEDAIFSGKYYENMSRREATAVELAERMAMDPHSVTDDFWAQLKEEFTDQEIVEMVFACSIFNWGNKFNITMRLDSDGNEYEKGMEYKDVDTFWRGRPEGA